MFQEKKKNKTKHLVKPLKPLNGYHPLSKLTFLPANTCTHSNTGTAKSQALKSTSACA